ncbi:MAG: flavodoxin family protein [Oscillospiraceae bacterium]
MAKKRVLIISSSPRKGGNSDMLCNAFLKGAESTGNTAEKIFLKDHTISYCTGCGYCGSHRGTCSQKDDMSKIKEKMATADILVFATPIYFYTMCGQMKTFLDRNCFFYPEIRNKEFYFIMTSADGNQTAMTKALNEFQGYLDCLQGAEVRGVIYGTGVWKTGEIAGSTHEQDAFNMGAGI